MVKSIRKVLGATVSIIRSGVVLDRTITGLIILQFLTTAEELHGVPARGHILLTAFLTAFLIEAYDEIGVNCRVLVGHVDESSGGVALHVVDVGLVHRAGVDQTLGVVFLVVYRPA